MDPAGDASFFRKWKLPGSFSCARHTIIGRRSCKRTAGLLLACVIAAVPFAPALAGHAPRPNPHPWNHPGCPCAAVLHPGSPQSAGLIRAPLKHLDDTVGSILHRGVTPGAVVLVARRGIIAKWKAYGDAARYTNANFDKMTHPVPMKKSTIFDLASVTKLFTATAVMQLWDEGKIKLDAPVATYLAKFGVNGKGAVTVRELLTHTSGFRPDPATPLYKISGNRRDRIDYVLQQPLEYPPQTHYVYSDNNFITLGALIEKVSGEREDRFIRQHITKPLHMRDTMYDPPASLKPRIAASEYQPWTKRGLLWGQVDDENAWALGGVAGHAGLFSDAHDLAIFGQMMLNGGTYRGTQILSKHAVKLLETNWDTKFPDNSTGLGWSINRGYFMGALSGPHTIGHEGFTGTTIVLDKPNDVVAILLMNRVHPTRHGASDVVARRQVYTDAAAAIPVAIPGSGNAWFSGYGNFLNRRLTAKVAVRGTPTLSFETWYRTEPDADYGIIEASSDGHHWTALGRLTGASHGWQRKTYTLPATTHYVRFDYRTNSRINGRGWYVHDVKLGGQGVTSWDTGKTGWLKRGY